VEASQSGDRNDHKGTRPGHGWRLTRASWRLTWRDRTVLLLALLGGICGVAAVAAVFLVIASHSDFGQSGHSRLLAAALLALYPLTFFIVFFDVAIAAATGARLEGGRMSFGEALRTAHQRVARIALWALLVLGFSFLLRFIGTRLPGGLGLATWPLDLLWVLATIFVVPLLALKDASVREALQSSRTLLKRGWGEALTGLVAIGILTFLTALPALFLLLIGIAAAALSGGSLVFVAAGVVGLVVARALAGALQQVFAVELYRYALNSST
jgi:hypothetical protein